MLLPRESAGDLLASAPPPADPKRGRVRVSGMRCTATASNVTRANARTGQPVDDTGDVGLHTVEPVGGRPSASVALSGHARQPSARRVDDEVDVEVAHRGRWALPCRGWWVAGRSSTSTTTMASRAPHARPPAAAPRRGTARRRITRGRRRARRRPRSAERGRWSSPNLQASSMRRREAARTPPRRITMLVVRTSSFGALLTSRLLRRDLSTMPPDRGRVGERVVGPAGVIASSISAAMSSR